VDSGALLALEGLVLTNQAPTYAWIDKQRRSGRADSEPYNLGVNPGFIFRAGYIVSQQSCCFATGHLCAAANGGDWVHISWRG